MNQVRLYPCSQPLDPDVIERFGRVTVSTISDSLERMAGAVGIEAVGDSLSSLGGRAMVGRAMTVRTRPGDNLAVHKALDLTEPGDVLVVDARGEMVNAILGELMAEYAALREVAGLVVDGAVRDRQSLSQGQVPVFAKGFSHLGPYKSGPGEIHGTVTIGGVIVQDGDVIVGDADGVVVVPRARATEALESAERIVESEAQQQKAIRSGTWDRSWIDATAETVYVGDGA